MVQNNLEVTGLITPLINAFKALGNEWKDLFDIGLTEYLHNQTDKYYLTNTFLHRFEKVKFFNVYFPIKVKYGQLTTQFTNPKDVLEEYKYITIIGTAGSGKSTLVKYIFLNSLKNLEKIPILIELRHLNEYNGDIEKLITEKILKLSAKPSAEILKRALHNGQFLFLLDGYDEIVSTKKQDLNRQVELFVDTYPKNYFIITTRPGSGIEQFPRFNDFRVCNLSKEDVDNFVNLLVIEKERRNRILSVIKDPRNKNYSDYLQNPLLLSMFILAFESHPEIPKKKSAFYRNVFDTLYSKHDGITKNSFPRERKTKLQRDDFEEILTLFSYLTLKDGVYAYTEEYIFNKLNLIKQSKYNFNNDDFIYDLQTSISVFIKDGFEYKFPHRSMQEYFAAQFIAKLPTDKKEKAYTNLISISKETSEDSGYNFWELCNELDLFAFNKFFIIPELRKITDMIDETNNTSLFLSFLEISNPTIFVTRNLNDNNKSTIIEEMPIFNFGHKNHYASLISFTTSYELHQFSVFLTKPDITKKITKLKIKKTKRAVRIGQTLELLEVDLQENRNIIDFLLKNNISKIVKDYKIQVLNKIKELELKIERERNQLDNILDL